MLDDGGADIARRTDRRERHKECVVALLPGDLGGFAHTVVALGLGDAADLRGPRLSPHRQSGIADAGGIGGPALLVDHRAHPVEDKGEVARGDAEPRKVWEALIAARRQPFLAQQVRDNRAAGDEARRHRRHLQGRRQNRALTDAGDQRLALLPAGPGGCQLPFARGDQPAALARDVEPERGAEAKAPGHRGDPVDAGAPRRLVKENVAGFLDRVAQMQRAVAGLLPAMKGGVAQFEIAGAGDRGVRGDDPRVERGERHHRLERRTRRIEAGDRLVGQRVARIGRQLLPGRRGEPR